MRHTGIVTRNVLQLVPLAISRNSLVDRILEGTNLGFRKYCVLVVPPQHETHQSSQGSRCCGTNIRIATQVQTTSQLHVPLAIGCIVPTRDEWMKRHLQYVIHLLNSKIQGGVFLMNLQIRIWWFDLFPCYFWFPKSLNHSIQVNSQFYWIHMDVY